MEEQLLDACFSLLQRLANDEPLRDRLWPRVLAILKLAEYLYRKQDESAKNKS